MDIEAQDRALSRAMRDILTFAKEQMPESMLCILSFTQADDESGISLNKISTNCGDREHLSVRVLAVMGAFAAAEVIDLTDVKGGMQ